MSEAGPTFVVEHYWPNSSPSQFERLTARLAAVIATIAEGGELALLHSTYVPADETAQWVFRAPSAGAVESLFAAAGVAFERLLPAIDSAEVPRTVSNQPLDRRTE